MLSQKKTNCYPLIHHTWKMSPHYLVNAKLFHPTEGNIAFFQTWVALKRTGCDMWQLECQASNVTVSVQSDHLLYGYMLPVFFATHQLHCPPRSAENQRMSQQDASAIRPHRGLILDTCALVACPRRGYLPGWGQDCWLATCQDWWTVNWGVSQRRSSTVPWARCAGALSFWKTNTSPAVLQIAGSSFCISNMSR